MKKTKTSLVRSFYGAFALSLLGLSAVKAAENPEVVLQVNGHYLKACLEVLHYESEAQLDQAAFSYYKSEGFREQLRRREASGTAVIGGVPLAANASEIEWGKFKQKLETISNTKLDAKSRSYFLETRGLKVIADTWLKAIEITTKSPLKVVIHNDSMESQDAAVTISFDSQGVYAKIDNVVTIGCEQKRNKPEAIGGTRPLGHGQEFTSDGKMASFRKEKGHPNPFIVFHTSLGSGVAVLKPFGAPIVHVDPPVVPVAIELSFPEGTTGEIRNPTISNDLKNQDWATGPNVLSYKLKWEILIDDDWKVRLKVSGETWEVEPARNGFWKTATYQSEVVKDFGDARRADPRLAGYNLVLELDEPAKSAEAAGGTEPGRPIGPVQFSGPTDTIVTGAEGNTGGGKAENGFWKLKATFRRFST